MDLVQKLTIIITLILFTITFYMYKNRKEFIDNSILVKGIVVSSKYNGKRNVPVIGFYTKDSVATYFSPSVNSDFDYFPINKRVEVLYYKENPEKAKINSFLRLWFSTALIGFLGSVFLFIGINIIFLTVKTEEITYK